MRLRKLDGELLSDSHWYSQVPQAAGTHLKFLRMSLKVTLSGLKPWYLIMLVIAEMSPRHALRPARSVEVWTQYAAREAGGSGRGRDRSTAANWC